MPHSLSVLPLSHFDSVCVVEASVHVRRGRLKRVENDNNDDACHLSSTYIVSTPS